MATVINNPNPSTHEVREVTTESSGVGFVVGLILLVLLAVLFFVYGLPGLRSAGRSATVNVPSHYDVNVNGGGSGSSGNTGGPTSGGGTTPQQ